MNDNKQIDSTDIIEPYGGKFVNLAVKKEERFELSCKANMLYYIQLSACSLRDIELL